MKIVHWNVRWATPRSEHSAEILSRIAQHTPELVCLTETHSGLLRDGHTVCSRPDYGYGIQETRRKVLLWSREPWERVDDISDERMPPGRFVSGVTLCARPWSSLSTAKSSTPDDSGGSPVRGIDAVDAEWVRVSLCHSALKLFSYRSTTPSPA